MHRLAREMNRARDGSGALAGISRKFRQNAPIGWIEIHVAVLFKAPAPVPVQNSETPSFSVALRAVVASIRKRSCALSEWRER
jgi:hypothetical protein